MTDDTWAATRVEDEMDDDERPSRVWSIVMMVLGFVMLLPFTLISLSAGPVFSPGAFVSGLLTVGWTFFVGLALLIYGWRRFKESRGDVGGGDAA